METVASGFGLLEAPRADAAGNVYFSDVTQGGVHRLAADGGCSTVVPKRRGIGGLVLHADGGVVVSGRDVVHVRDGVTRLLLRVDGVVGFNDLTTDAAGRVFVGSLRSDATETGPRIPGELWRIDDAERAVEVYRDIEFANGLGFSPDGRTLYHSNYSVGVVLAHDVAPDGTAANRRVFARLPRGEPDGLAVDEAGGVWVALGSGAALARFTPDGKLDRTLDVPASFVASLCFGGADRRDVWIATAGALLKTRVDVPGLIAPPARV